MNWYLYLWFFSVKSSIFHIEENLFNSIINQVRVKMIVNLVHNYHNEDLPYKNVICCKPVYPW